MLFSLMLSGSDEHSIAPTADFMLSLRFTDIGASSCLGTTPLSGDSLELAAIAA